MRGHERSRPSGRVGIGNRSVETRVKGSVSEPIVANSTQPSARTILETWITLGVLHKQDLERTPEDIFMDSIREAEELDGHDVVYFHRGLTLDLQDEIAKANGRGLIGVHLAEYTLLRRRGIDHEHALVLAQEAARIRFGDPASETTTSQAGK